jgi:hypothetical protein
MSPVKVWINSIGFAFNAVLWPSIHERDATSSLPVIASRLRNNLTNS